MSNHLTRGEESVNGDRQMIKFSSLIIDQFSNMKYFTFNLAISGLIYFAIPKMEAQSNTVTTGGDASAASGSVSYSIGQIEYISATGSNGHINQGLQQPFEFYIITGSHEDKINLSIKAFPNPTDYIINLVVDLSILSNLNYQLFNLQSQLIESKNIQTKNSLIDLSSYLPGTYILRITRNQHEIKSFKIIKNQ